MKRIIFGIILAGMLMMLTACRSAELMEEPPATEENSITLTETEKISNGYVLETPEKESSTESFYEYTELEAAIRKVAEQTDPDTLE